MRDKVTLTQEFLKLLSINCELTLEQARVKWWYNIRKDGGMRLTKDGFDVLSRQLEVESYDYVIEDPLTFNAQMILELDRKLQMPYYIWYNKKIPEKLIFFGGKEMVMARLYGDLAKFIKNYT